MIDRASNIFATLVVDHFAASIIPVNSAVAEDLRGREVAKLADAPDLGLRNHRFQSAAFRCKTKRLYEGKAPILAKLRNATKGEQKSSRSSTNSSTGDALDSL